MITTASAIGTILNDDPTALAIKPLSASLAEGNSGSTPFTFTVTRSGVTTGASSAHWAVTGSGAAPANAADFTGGVLPSGTVSFAAGQTSKTITVNVAGDTTVEPNEQFAVKLSSPIGAVITTATATGRIMNDDTIAATNRLSSPAQFLVSSSVGAGDVTTANLVQLPVTTQPATFAESIAVAPDALDLAPLTLAPVDLQNYPAGPLPQAAGGADSLLSSEYRGASGSALLIPDHNEGSDWF